MTPIDGQTPAGFEDFAVVQVGPLLALARVLTDTPEDAEELVQDALLRIYRHWRRVSRADDPAAYARRVLVNQFRSSLRGRRFSTSPVSEFNNQPDPRSDIDELTERVTIAEAIRHLSPRQRTVIVLRFYLQLDTGEIASWTGTADSSVRATLSRALEALRRVTGAGDAAKGNDNGHHRRVPATRTEPHEREC